MKKNVLLFALALLIGLSSQSFRPTDSGAHYEDLYHLHISELKLKHKNLIDLTQTVDFTNEIEISALKEQICSVRNTLKENDFWLRYLEPVSYKQINGPLPVEWETEVFEKFEKPYRREGAGLSLALQALSEKQNNNEAINKLLKASQQAIEVYERDSIVAQLKTPGHFYFCNRLFLLNLATIYTSGFECPEPSQIIRELRQMLNGTQYIYEAYGRSFPDYALSVSYLNLYQQCKQFVSTQSSNFEAFDHYTLIREYINPLFSLNQQLIKQYNLQSQSLVDYSLNDKSSSIFSKTLYRGQNSKGIYSRVYQQEILTEIKKLGELLFFDPILSGNNQRSCASCHKPNQEFTDTLVATSLQFNGTDYLKRNTPSLVNSIFNHLLMQDGLHTTLQQQAKAVISNPLEMHCEEKDLLKKILSCKTYKDGFSKLLPYTPQEPVISLEHVYSALTLYYGEFSRFEAPFDQYMNKKLEAPEEVKSGFNVFMSKAQCATCHFAPIFNGVKPPYVSSEFEVLGVPSDTSYKALSKDNGRHDVFSAPETYKAFRTGTIRNASRTKPYMHNGVFMSLEQLIDFYDIGGGQGHGLEINNQTLAADSLKLSALEKKQLLAFMHSLNEQLPKVNAPNSLPQSKYKHLNNRKPGGTY